MADRPDHLQWDEWLHRLRHPVPGVIADWPEFVHPHVAPDVDEGLSFYRLPMATRRFMRRAAIELILPPYEDWLQRANCPARVVRMAREWLIRILWVPKAPADTGDGASAFTDAAPVREAFTAWAARHPVWLELALDVGWWLRLSIIGVSYGTYPSREARLWSAMRLLGPEPRDVGPLRRIDFYRSPEREAFLRRWWRVATARLAVRDAMAPDFEPAIATPPALDVSTCGGDKPPAAAMPAAGSGIDAPLWLASGRVIPRARLRSANAPAPG